MSKTIMIVDDEKDIVHALKTVMATHGFTVVTASDGHQAFKMLSSITPDLMIVDLTMPVLDGWRLAMKVRQEERFKKTPIIVLSALIDSQRDPEVYEPGSIYMTKPFDVFEILKKVKELLGVV